MKETVGDWMANQCLKGFEVKLIDTKKSNNIDITRTFGAFDKTGKLMDTKTHRYK